MSPMLAANMLCCGTLGDKPTPQGDRLPLDGDSPMAELSFDGRHRGLGATSENKLADHDSRHTAPPGEAAADATAAPVAAAPTMLHAMRPEDSAADAAAVLGTAALTMSAAYASDAGTAVVPSPSPAVSPIVVSTLTPTALRCLAQKSAFFFA